MKKTSNGNSASSGKTGVTSGKRTASVRQAGWPSVVGTRQQPLTV